MRNKTMARIAGYLALGICMSISAVAEKSISFAARPDMPAVPSRVVDRVDDARLVTLRGNTHFLALPKYDRGLLDPDMKLARMVLALKRSPEQEKALAEFDERLLDPKSSDFHHWMHAEEFGLTYGPSDADIAAVTTWLLSHGFSIDQVSKGRIWIQFTGSAAQVQEAFHVEMHRYLVNGKQHIANDRDPSIPEALAPVVAGVASLHDFFGRHMSGEGRYVRRDPKTGRIAPVEPRPASVAQSSQGLSPVAGNGSKRSLGSENGGKMVHPELTYTDGNNYIHEDLTPADFGIVYNITPLWNAGITGTGVTVAITATSDVTLSDVATYRSAFGLPATTVHTIQSDPAADPGINYPSENTEDLEMVSAAAPGATLDLVVSKATATTAGYELSNEYIVDKEVAPVMTVSYGVCELALGTAGNTNANNVLQMGATEGISIFIAAGDSGSATCESQNAAAPVADNFGLEVSGYASSPYVTAVGGTDFTWSYVDQPISTHWNASNGTNLATAKGYMPEIPWNTTCANPLLVPLFTSGGTQLFTDTEGLCNGVLDTYTDYEALVKLSAGGGGVSHCTVNNTPANPTSLDPTSCSGGYAKPSWQKGTGVPNDNLRDVPDIAMFASYGYGFNGFPAGVEIDSTAILICVTDTAHGISCNAADYTNPSEVIYQENGGTSAASPFSAGVMALVLQKTGQVQGLANPVFYKLAAAESLSACNSQTVAAGNSCVFYDITQGSNAQACVTGSTPDCITKTSGDQAGILNGYNAGVGYDQASGLGSMNVSNLVNKWASAAGAPAVTLTPSSLTFPSTLVGSTSASQTITIKNTGTAALSITNLEIAGTNFSSFNATSTGAGGCSATLAAGASCAVTFTFAPASAGALTATFEVMDNAGTGTQTAALSGTGSSPTTTVSVSPASLTFASTQVGSTTAAQTVTVKNTGANPVTLTSETVTGTNATSFVKSATTCGTTLASGASCTVSVEFKPATPAALSASLSVADNATGSPQTVSLSGTGTSAPALTVSLSPTTLTFASTAVGATTAAQLVTVKNTGTASVTLTSETIAGINATSFLKSATTCGTTLAASATCTVSVEFKPTAAGALAASLSVADNATGSPQTVALKGTGAAAAGVTLSPTSIAFPATVTLATSDAQVLTLKNGGTAAITISSIALGGTNPTSFLELSGCGTSLAAGASCPIYVAFKPGAAKALNATLTVTDTGAGSPQKVTLTGTGTAVPSVKLSVTTLAFGTVKHGTVSAPKAVTITNSGTAALNLTSITLSGTNPTDFEDVDTCTPTLAPAASCTVYVAFKPATAAAFTAKLSVADNGTASPQSVTLTGTGN